ncbi:MAG: hypothetical protein K8U57_30540 [Planctomycetes bacterium]|nr:hypothetical protein [Planctomycetota bacterium]
MTLAERNLLRHKWRMATEDARRNEGPLFQLGVVCLGAILIIAGLNETLGIGR